MVRDQEHRQLGVPGRLKTTAIGEGITQSVGRVSRSRNKKNILP